MFGKKKKKTEESKPEEPVETSTAEAELDNSAKKSQKKLTELEKQLLEKIQNYNQHYAGVFNANQVAGYAIAELEAQKLTLGFAIFSELVELRRVLESMKEDGEE